MRPKKSLLRKVGRSVLEDRGYIVQTQTSQGVLEGARLLARKDVEELDVAVRTSYERSLSFTKRSKNQWRTLGSVDLVLAVVPDSTKRGHFEVLAFESKDLIRTFNKAWKALEEANRALSSEIPIFIPLDESSRKNVGHNVSNLKDLAVWCEAVGPEKITAQSLADKSETFIERAKREFAERNGVDVSEVVVEFRLRK